MCDGIFSTSDASEYRSVKVVDTYAYIVSEDAGHGMQVSIASRKGGILMVKSTDNVIQRTVKAARIRHRWIVSFKFVLMAFLAR